MCFADFFSRLKAIEIFGNEENLPSWISPGRFATQRRRKRDESSHTAAKASLPRVVTSRDYSLECIWLLHSVCLLLCSPRSGLTTFSGAPTGIRGWKTRETECASSRCKLAAQKKTNAIHSGPKINRYP